MLGHVGPGVRAWHFCAETSAKRHHSRPMYTELPLVIGALIMHFNIDLVEMADEQEASNEETPLFSHSGDLPVGLRARKKRS